MKKLLCVVAVIALVLALAAPAFASDGIPVVPSAENKGNNNTPAKNVTPAAPAAVKSPATGYATLLWVISAAVMTACAGYCFYTGKKSAAY